MKTEQEPVAWYYPGGSPDQCTTNKAYAEMEPAWTPLYTSPPQRSESSGKPSAWVGLTRDEQSFVYSNLHNATSREDSFWVDFANAIEAKLKEKNT